MNNLGTCSDNKSLSGAIDTILTHYTAGLGTRFYSVDKNFREHTSACMLSEDSINGLNTLLLRRKSVIKFAGAQILFLQMISEIDSVHIEISFLRILRIAREMNEMQVKWNPRETRSLQGTLLIVVIFRYRGIYLAANDSLPEINEKIVLLFKKIPSATLLGSFVERVSYIEFAILVKRLMTSDIEWRTRVEEGQIDNLAVVQFITGGLPVCDKWNIKDTSTAYMYADPSEDSGDEAWQL